MVVYTIALIIHVIICVALVLVILSQNSKGGLDANLGGAAMNVFGGSGASKFLRQWTQILGVVFVASCVFLAIQVKSTNKTSTPKILQEKFSDKPQPATKTTTAKPATTKPAAAEKK